MASSKQSKQVRASSKKAAKPAKPARKKAGVPRGAPSGKKKVGATAKKLADRQPVVDAILAMGATKRGPGGRPTEYDPVLCEAVVVHAAATGLSLTAFAGEIGVSRQCLSEWGHKHPEFSVAMAQAKAARAAFLEREAMGGLNAAWVNYRVLALKNCAPDDFRDTTDVRHGGLPGAPPIATAALDVSKLTREQIYAHVMNGAPLPDPEPPSEDHNG